MLLIGLTFFGLIVTAIWALIDLFLIPSMINEKVESMRQKMILDTL